MNLSSKEKFNLLVKSNVPLADFTTYKIGGPAKYFVKVKNFEDLEFLLEYAKEHNINWFIIGGGSNLLISDNGFDGLVLKLAGDFDSIYFDESDNSIVCGAGTSLSKIVNYYIKNNFLGSEFLCGIPGKIGGAVKMNAGLKTQWLSSLIKWVKVLNNDCSIIKLNKNQIDWDYRYSSIKSDQIVLEVALDYKNANSDKDIQDAQEKIEELLAKRKNSQPYNFPCCGSVFKNPEGEFSAKLIEEAGLKGLTIGGAQVSEKHANFIINKDGAKAKDVVDIIQKIQIKVHEKNDIMLKPELKFVGFTEECSLF